jgi:hypothetical protein
METVFKEGDKVYCVVNGHGFVKEIKCKADYPVYVEFTNDDSDQYTYDGRLYMDSLPTLSFTEYSLQGFSQERQIELPEVGDLCLFRDYDEDTWKVRKFDRYTSYSEFPFFDGSSSWKQMKRIKILD